jgi:hypothetical protein
LCRDSDFSCISVYVGVVINTGNMLLGDYILIKIGAPRMIFMYALKQHNRRIAIAKHVTYLRTFL